MKQLPAFIIALLLFAPCASAVCQDAFGSDHGRAKNLMGFERDYADGGESEAVEIYENVKQDVVSIEAKTES
ncbi:MAG: hypothetical protein PHH26_06840, partial [Candidatus Thermoplasmatota archaeon]|nr:hypothetical protein [Candidatus Thermoplasmatota archaeon]